jgi:hypothetical protein
MLPFKQNAILILFVYNTFFPSVLSHLGANGMFGLGLMACASGHDGFETATWK